jgi:hypothetical protein
MTSLPNQGPSRHVYTGRSTCWPIVACFALVAVLLPITARPGDAPWSDVALPLLLVAVGVFVSVLTASSVRATAGPNGLTIHWGVVGWPRCTYRLDEIEHAEVIDVPWWLVSWGLWWTPKRTCCTIRSGPTVRLTLRNHRTVTVTVPDPNAAVAALRAAMPSGVSA